MRKIVGLFKKYQPLEDDTVSITVSVPQELVDEIMLINAAKFYRKMVVIVVQEAAQEEKPLTLDEEFDQAEDALVQALTNYRAVTEKIKAAVRQNVISGEAQTPTLFDSQRTGTIEQEGGAG